MKLTQFYVIFGAGELYYLPSNTIFVSMNFLGKRILIYFMLKWIINVKFGFWFFLQIYKQTEKSQYKILCWIINNLFVSFI